MAETSNNVEVAVVMVPLPAQSHLNRLLHLSSLISAYHLPLHFAGTTVHLRQAKNRVQGWDPLSTSRTIQFHEFPIPNYETPLPNPNSTTKFPSQLIPSFHATCHLRHPVSSLLRELSKNYRRVIVIYDFLVSWVLQDVVSIPNVECYSSRSISAFSIHTWDESFVTPEFTEFFKLQMEYREIINSGDLFNSCYEIEGLYLDLLAKEEKNARHKQWAVGSLNPLKQFDKNDSNKSHRCIEWLDNQEANSVIFVSFGTTTSLSDEEVKELAIGLEKSQQKFIWVLRDTDKGDIYTGETREIELPEGYEKRVEKRGLIVRDWAESIGNIGTRVNRWIHESLRVEFMYGEYFIGSASSSLANAFRSTKKCFFDNRGAENWSRIEKLGN